MRNRLISALFILTISACAQMPPKIAEQQDAPPSVSTAKAKPLYADLPNQDLTNKLLFEYLLAETALQRDHPQVAIGTYLDLAKSTRDPRIAQRATEVALATRQAQAALEAATIWLQTAPDSVTARQTVAALLVNAGKLDEARPHLEKLLVVDPANVGKAFLQLNNLLARHSQKAATLKLVTQLAQPHATLPESHFAVAQAALLANELEVALAASKRALQLKPGWELAAVYQGQIRQKQSAASAEAFYKQYLRDYPKSNEVRLSYARLLVAEKNYAAARNEFQQLLADNANNADIALAVALLSMELRDFDVAETNLKRLLALNYKDPDDVHFYLAQIYEETKRIPQAMAEYLAIDDGERYFPAQIKYADLLAKQGKLSEARTHLRELPADNNQQRAQVILAESQLLREAHLYQQAFDFLSASLEKLPNYPDLLYDRAMTAEKLDQLVVMEQDLRKVIQIKPDHAHAYNALGYSLADRGERLPEALALIEKAVQLAPDDPFILDSLGWAHYRMGNLTEGLKQLQRAYAAKPDPEIAAHLGELLWRQGAKEKAREIWQAALKSHPTNESLLSVIKKFAP